jgi:glutamyl/glutaminyl-tRNA synthetase
MKDEELKLFKEKLEVEYKIKETGEKISLDLIKKIILLYQERLKKLSEISELTDFFFKGKLIFEKELLRWKNMADREIKTSLDRLLKILSKIKEGEWNKENLQKYILPEAEKLAKELKREGDRGCLLWPFRVALTGKEASAPPFEIAEILGKKKTIQRIKEARKLL